MTEFLALLYITPTTFFIAAFPVLRPLLNHVQVALATSQADPWAKHVWWDWPGSWIFIGGPFGRWVVGTVLGLRILDATHHDADSGRPGSVVEQPHLGLLIVTSLGFLFSLFALVIIFVSIYS